MPTKNPLAYDRWTEAETLSAASVYDQLMARPTFRSDPTDPVAVEKEVGVHLKALGLRTSEFCDFVKLGYKDWHAAYKKEQKAKLDALKQQKHEIAEANS